MTITARQLKDHELDLAVAAIGYARPHLIDAADAAIVAESLGYTDSRVRRELGLDNVYELGQLAFTRLAERPLPPRVTTRDDAGVGSRRGSVWPTFAIVLVWLAALGIDASRLINGPPVQIALMSSLIVAGGFVLAMRHRAGLYAHHQQPAVATSVSGYVFRLGATAAVAAAATGFALGLALRVAPWPVGVLWTDEVVVFSALWLAWAAWSMRRASRERAAAASASRAPLPLPRLTVVLWQMLPWIAYGSAFFAVIFAGPLLAADASSRALWNAGATALLVAMGAAERGRKQFAAAVDVVVRATRDRDGDRLRRAAADAHTQATVVTAAVFAGVAAVAVPVALRSRPVADASTVTTLGLILGGYLLVAGAVANAAVLFSVGRGWAAGWTFVAGLVALLCALVSNALLIQPVGMPAAFTVAAAVVAALSTVAVRRAVRGLDHAAAHPFIWK